jgi:iron complex transport system substrate-binding protein
MGRYRVFRRLGIGLVLALAVAACGDDGGSATTSAGATTVATTAAAITEPETTTTSAAAATTTATPTEDGFPVMVDGVTVPALPKRIISASASHTEMLFAIGAGAQVAATDLFSDYPAKAADTEKFDAFNISVEAVAGLDPDLVILAFDPGDTAAGLEALGIPTLLFDAPATLEDVYEQIVAVGDASGHRDEASTLIDDMRSSIDEILAGVPLVEIPFTYYHELDTSGFTVTSETFIGSLYELVGLENVADPADDVGSGYPQLTTEFLFDADPDFIFLADTKCCGQTAATIAERSGWDVMTAVREGRVIELDDDVASRWGPRVVDFLEIVVAAVYGTP